MSSRERTVALLEAVFAERKVPAPRGRQGGPRRPERSSKAGFKGRGYTDPGGKMKGRDRSNEQPPPKLPAEKKKTITEFEDSSDWILSMLLVSIMHANPGMTPEEAVKTGKEWAKKMYMPRMEHVWRDQTSRIRRYGIRAEASKIRRELFKLI